MDFFTDTYWTEYYGCLIRNDLLGTYYSQLQSNIFQLCSNNRRDNKWEPASLIPIRYDDETDTMLPSLQNTATCLVSEACGFIKGKNRRQSITVPRSGTSLVKSAILPSDMLTATQYTRSRAMFSQTLQGQKIWQKSGHTKCEVQKCEYAKLATFKVQNKNVKVYICTESTAEDWRCAQCEWNWIWCQTKEIMLTSYQLKLSSHFISHFICRQARTFAF